MKTFQTLREYFFYFVSVYFLSFLRKIKFAIINKHACFWAYIHKKHLKIEHSGSTLFDFNALLTALSILSVV